MGFWSELGIDVKDVAPLLQSINSQLQSINARLAVSGMGGSNTITPTIKTQNYKGHLWLTLPQNISNMTARYDLPHRIDAIACTCPYDFQFDVDKDVNPSTPVNVAFSYPSFDMEGNSFISYRIPQAVYNAKQAKGVDLTKEKIPFLVFLFWYGD